MTSPGLIGDWRHCVLPQGMKKITGGPRTSDIARRSGRDAWLVSRSRWNRTVHLCPTTGNSSPHQRSDAIALTGAPGRATGLVTRACTFQNWSTASLCHETTSRRERLNLDTYYCWGVRRPENGLEVGRVKPSAHELTPRCRRGSNDLPVPLRWGPPCLGRVIG